MMLIDHPYFYAKRPSPWHIVMKSSKVNDKEGVLKAAKEKKKVIYRGIPFRLSADFSAEKLQARKE